MAVSDERLYNTYEKHTAARIDPSSSGDYRPDSNNYRGYRKRKGQMTEWIFHSFAVPGKGLS